MQMYNNKSFSIKKKLDISKLPSTITNYTNNCHLEQI